MIISLKEEKTKQRKHKLNNENNTSVVFEE
jgi:hypothetical protein